MNKLFDDICRFSMLEDRVSEKESDLLEVSQFRWFFSLAGKGQAPVRIGSDFPFNAKRFKRHYFKIATKSQSVNDSSTCWFL